MSHRGLPQKITTLLEKKHLLSASQILSELEKSGETYNKTSVYRAIEKLTTDNSICQHNFSGSQSVFELRDHHHDHVVCTNCGSIAIIDCIYTQPAVLAGVTINHHHTTFFGHCEKCL